MFQALTHSNGHRLWRLLVSIVARRELAEQQPGSLIVSQCSGFGIVEESQVVADALELNIYMLALAGASFNDDPTS